jgi:uncharacterized membrane protein HdeD (DUF308 family)
MQLYPPLTQASGIARLLGAPTEDLSKFAKFFGRNASEVLTTTVGLGLAVFNIVTLSMEIAKDINDDNKWMLAVDILGLVSAALQLIQVVATGIAAIGGKLPHSRSFSL